jgi:predicted metal-dependent peptidase
VTDLDRKRRIAMLEATLRELLAIDAAAAIDTTGSMPADQALDGALLARYRRMKRKAEALLKGTT